MTFLILITLLNGIVIALARTVNGQLSQHAGAWAASFWNHLVGFLLLTLMVLVVYGMSFVRFDWDSIPLWAWLGGFFGTFFVLTSSQVFSKLGAMRASLLVIAGQIVSALVFDTVQTGGHISWMRLLGVMLIALGIFLSAWRKSAQKSLKIGISVNDQ